MITVRKAFMFVFAALLPISALAARDSRPWNPDNWEILTPEAKGFVQFNEIVWANGQAVEESFMEDFTQPGQIVTSRNYTTLPFTAYSYADGTVTAKMKWVGIGPAPSQVLVRLNSMSQFGGLNLPDMEGSASNGLDAPLEDASSPPWVGIAESTAYEMKPVIGGILEWEVPVHAVSYGTSSGTNANNSVTSAVQVGAVDIALAEKALVIGTELEPNYTVGPNNTPLLVENPVPNNKTLYTRIHRGWEGFPAQDYYFGYVDIEPVLEGAWDQPGNVVWSAPDAESILPIGGGKYRAMFRLPWQSVMVAMIEQRKMTRTITGSVVDFGVGPGIRHATLTVHFVPPRVYTHRSPDVEKEDGWYLFGQMEDIPPHQVRIFHTIEQVTGHIVNHVWSDNFDEYPFLDAYCGFVSVEINRTIGESAPISDNAQDWVYINNHTSDTWYGTRKRRHWYKETTHTFQVWGKNGFERMGETIFRLWRNAQRDSVSYWDYTPGVQVW